MYLLFPIKQIKLYLKNYEKNLRYYSALSLQIGQPFNKSACHNAFKNVRTLHIT